MAQIEAKSWGVGVNVPEGRCVVNLDESALRMLEPTQHPPNPVQASYHSFKYHFKPESIDVRKPGKVQPANPPRVVEGVALDVEQLGSNNEDKHLFTAVEQGTKELDVFMIFDPTTGAFTMYEADSSVLLTYDRAASKAASRSRSRTSPASQPLTALPATTAPAKQVSVPAPAPTPVRLPTAAEPPAAGSSTPTVKRAVAPKPKKPKPKPVPVEQPAPAPVPAPEETEEGELELEPVSIPEQPQDTIAMEVDNINHSEPGAVDTEPDGILPWDAVPTTSHKRAGNTTTSAFNAADGPDEEVLHFGGSLGASSAREPSRKAQSKSGRSGGIVFPKAAPRGRDPPPRAPPPPPLHNPELDDEEMFEMDEVVLPGMESHSNDLEAEIMKQLQSESSEDDDDEEEEEEDDDDGDGGFDVQAFEQALAQEVPQGDDDSDSDDDDSSSEEDD